jgi:hypothetical protein
MGHDSVRTVCGLETLFREADATRHAARPQASGDALSFRSHWRDSFDRPDEVMLERIERVADAVTVK